MGFLVNTLVCFLYASAQFVAAQFNAQILNPTAPTFQYDTTITSPTWSTMTFLLTRYNATSSSNGNNNIRNRLHIEFFYDDPNNVALISQSSSEYVKLHYVQESYTTPDPYGILTDLYSQVLNVNKNERFIFPTMQLTIPFTSQINQTAAKWFVQGFKPDGISRGSPIRYVVQPQMTSPSQMQMTLPLTPFDQTWCSTSEDYQCPPGAPWNAGIPYLYPRAINLDVNDYLFDALKKSTMFGYVNDIKLVVKMKSGTRAFNISHVPCTFQYKLNTSLPMFQPEGPITPEGGISMPYLQNGL